MKSIEEIQKLLFCNEKVEGASIVNWTALDHYQGLSESN